MKNILKSVGLVILNLGLQFLVQTVFAAAGMVGGLQDDAALTEWIMDRILGITIISNGLFVIIVWLFCKLKKADLKTQWKLNKAGTGAYVMACIIAFTYSMAFSLFTYDAAANAVSPTRVSAEFYGQWGIWMLALALLISAPVTEEIMCRALMLNILKKSFSVPVAILISSAVFGVMHILAGGVSLVIGAFIMGLLLAVIYEKTKSLWVVIVAHMAANLPDFILFQSPEIGRVAKILMIAGLLLISAGCLWEWIKHDYEK
ncbi:MAG: CPBP family intramembrane metalloprotease [Lachnospiraceae bacterium]|nr:CPBP family intramembrane metalloprotease [Lachnospiraceae bacterium]